MIGADLEIEAIEGAALSAVVTEGLTARTADGRPARLAILDADGNVVAEGEAVARQAWTVALQCYRNFLRGQGHLRVQPGPAREDACR